MQLNRPARCLGNLRRPRARDHYARPRTDGLRPARQEIQPRLSRAGIQPARHRPAHIRAPAAQPDRRVRTRRLADRRGAERPPDDSFSITRHGGFGGFMTPPGNGDNFTTRTSDPRRLAGLVSITDNPADAWTPQDLAAIWKHQLNSPLTFDLSA